MEGLRFLNIALPLSAAPLVRLECDDDFMTSVLSITNSCWSMLTIKCWVLKQQTQSEYVGRPFHHRGGTMRHHAQSCDSASNSAISATFHYAPICAAILPVSRLSGQQTILQPHPSTDPAEVKGSTAPCHRAAKIWGHNNGASKAFPSLLVVNACLHISTTNKANLR